MGGARETEWMKILLTAYPNGVNDSSYLVGSNFHHLTYISLNT